MPEWLNKNIDQQLPGTCHPPAESYDVESGLLNFRAFLDSTSVLLRQASASGKQVALIWIDILNLCHEFALGGWPGVTALVSRAANQLREAAGSQSCVGRFDGRSFMIAILVPDFAEDGRGFANLVADELIHSPRTGSSSPLYISVGVAFCPVDTNSPEELLRFACLAARASLSTGTELDVRPKLPIRLTPRQATGEALLRTLTASRSPAASFCSYIRERSRVL